MNELDRKIQETLQKDDAEWLSKPGTEPSMAQKLMETFQGRHRWLNILGAGWMTVFVILAVVSAVRFFRAEPVRETLMWAAAFIVCISVISLLKIWFWLELEKNAILREIKRLEWQIARLTDQLRK